MSGPLDPGQVETLTFAPLWVYAAVAAASGPPEPSQFRKLQEELDVADRRLEGSEVARAAVTTLRTSFEARWAAFQEHGADPKKGLERTRDVLNRLPDDERESIARWLVEVAIRIGEASRMIGEPAISDGEVKAIRDIAKWLGAPKPDLGPR